MVYLLGILGHAAIANGNNNILDIPVAGQPTRQLALKDGCQKYKARKGWIKSISFKESKKSPSSPQIGRIETIIQAKELQNKLSNPHTLIVGSRYSTNPTYCSKIVMQAYYFGKGKAKVLWNLPVLVAP